MANTSPSQRSRSSWVIMAITSFMAVSIVACAEDPGVARSAAQATTLAPASTATTTTLAASTTVTVAPKASTTTVPTTTSTPDPIAEEPPIFPTGTLLENGTELSTELPEGAIGPSTVVVGESGKTLTQLLGISTYRIRSTYSIEVAGEPTHTLAIDAAIHEAADPDLIDTHEIWSEVDLATAEQVRVSEMVRAGGQRYVLDLEDDEWEAVGEQQEVSFLGPFYRSSYATMDELTIGLLGAIWIGNEEIDGVPVGHFEIPALPAEYDTTDGAFASRTEFWIDSGGVVRRIEFMFNYNDGEMIQTGESTLYDIGADITITAPDLGS